MKIGKLSRIDKDQAFWLVEDSTLDLVVVDAEGVVVLTETDKFMSPSRTRSRAREKDRSEGNE